MCWNVLKNTLKKNVLKNILKSLETSSRKHLYYVMRPFASWMVAHLKGYSYNLVLLNNQRNHYLTNICFLKKTFPIM